MMKYKSRYNYRVVSGLKAFIRDAINDFRNLFLKIFFGKDSRMILFYPQFPDWNADLHQALFWSKYRLTSNPNHKFDFVVNWEDCTHRKWDKTLTNLSKEHYVVNLYCKNISKSKVESVFKDTFGYSTFIDPTNYSGLVIEKSDLNSKHSLIKIIMAPIKEPQKGFIYQKYITNQSGSYSIDYRVPFVNHQIPMVFVRFKPPDDVFDTVHQYQIAQPSEIFTAQELKNIQLFCRKMKLDYGELDIIRSQADNLIYIIDVNNTPHKPRSTCTSKQRWVKNKSISKLFIEDISKKERAKKAKEKALNID